MERGTERKRQREGERGIGSEREREVRQGERGDMRRKRGRELER